MARSVPQVNWGQHRPVGNGDRRGGWRRVLSPMTKAEIIVVGGMDTGLIIGVGERVMERTGKIVITPGSGQNKATHSQGDLWLIGEVPSRQLDTGPRAQKEDLSQQ